MLVRDRVVNFSDIWPETSKSSSCCNMGGNSHLQWLPSKPLSALLDETGTMSIVPHSGGGGGSGVASDRPIRHILSATPTVRVSI